MCWYYTDAGIIAYLIPCCGENQQRQKYHKQKKHFETMTLMGLVLRDKSSRFVDYVCETYRCFLSPKNMVWLHEIAQ